MLSKSLNIFVVCILLVSCVSLDSGTPERSQFVLLENLFIQSDSSKIFFQDNGPIRPFDVNEYEPYCSLDTELSSTSRNPIEVQADTFTITKIENNSTVGKSYTVSGGQKAGVNYTTKFLLASEKQSFVHSLVCRRWVVGSLKRYLSIADIEQIIGNKGKFIK